MQYHIKGFSFGKLCLWDRNMFLFIKNKNQKSEECAFLGLSVIESLLHLKQRNQKSEVDPTVEIFYILKSEIRK